VFAVNDKKERQSINKTALPTNINMGKYTNKDRNNTITRTDISMSFASG